MRMKLEIKPLLLAALLLGSLGCGAAQQPARKNISESVRMFNQSVYWKNWGQVRGYLEPSMTSWFKRRMLLGAHYADWSVMSVTPEGDSKASVIIQRQLYTDTNTVLQTELVEQIWIKKERELIWMVQSELPFNPVTEVDAAGSGSPAEKPPAAPPSPPVQIL